ncbi:MAG: PEGA domain-containing protein, partial [Myxococcaceae bacterium]
ITGSGPKEHPPMAIEQMAKPTPNIEVVPSEEMPKRVRLLISSDPPGAKIIRTDNGKPLGTTPLEYTASAGTRPVKVRFQLSGYISAERVLALDTDSRLSVELQPGDDSRKGNHARKQR